jgi:hypothetical protein
MLERGRASDADGTVSVTLRTQCAGRAKHEALAATARSLAGLGQDRCSAIDRGRRVGCAGPRSWLASLVGGRPRTRRSDAGAHPALAGAVSEGVDERVYSYEPTTMLWRRFCCPRRLFALSIANGALVCGWVRVPGSCLTLVG